MNVTALTRTYGRVSVAILGVLVLFRVTFPLAVLSASPGRLLSGIPKYKYDPLGGDAYGYYYCVRELLATSRRDVLPFAAGVIVAAALVALAWRRSKRRTTRVLAVTWATGIVVAVLAHYVRFTGAAQLGWPLIWSIPLFPLRVAGSSISPDVAFGFGLALSVICNVATVLATYVIGLNIGLRNRVALLGAALVALWPLVSLLAGSRGALNGTWQIDLGLSLYTEPLSTALVVTALALVVGRAGEDRRAALAGALLGLGTLVRLSNVLILGCVLVALFVVRERRRAAVLALGAAAWAPATLLFWPKSYPKLKAPVFPAHPFEWRYAGHAWTDSTLWRPAVVLVLVPLALIGIKRAAPRAAVLLWSCVAVTALFYSFYELTPIHPRFLFVVLPIVLLFWAAGADVVVAAGRGLYDRGR